MFNNNGGQGGGTGPYDYIGSPQHAEAMRFEHEQALNRERNNGNARFQDGVTYGANAAWANANVQINQLKREREKLILQVQDLQNELNRVIDVAVKNNAIADSDIQQWEEYTEQLKGSLSKVTDEKDKLIIENEELKKQTSGSEELYKVIRNLQEANKNMLTKIKDLTELNTALDSTIDGILFDSGVYQYWRDLRSQHFRDETQ